MLQRTLCPLAAADVLTHVAGESGIVEHVQVGVEQFAFLGAEVPRHLGVDPLDVVPGLADRTVEQRELRLDIVGVPVRNKLQACGRQHDVGRADADSGDAGYTVEARFGGDRSVAGGEALDFAGRLRVRHEAANDSSPIPATAWNRSWLDASSRLTGSARSATRPMRPSEGPSDTLPTICGLKPSLATKVNRPVAPSRK